MVVGDNKVWPGEAGSGKGQRGWCRGRLAVLREGTKRAEPRATSSGGEQQGQGREGPQ